MDEWGYSELVIHPPPLNIFTLFLLPGILRKGTMKQLSDLFGKFIFWFENIFYLLAFIFLEASMIPLIYVKQIYNAYKQLSLTNASLLMLFWVPLAPFLLLTSLF
jgi:hypothetical protein